MIGLVPLHPFPSVILYLPIHRGYSKLDLVLVYRVMTHKYHKQSPTQPQLSRMKCIVDVLCEMCYRRCDVYMVEGYIVTEAMPISWTCVCVCVCVCACVCAFVRA